MGNKHNSRALRVQSFVRHSVIYIIVYNRFKVWPHKELRYLRYVRHLYLVRSMFVM